MLAQLGNFAVHQGRYSVARGMHREAIELARDIGARRLGGGFLNNLGETEWLLGNYDAAFDLFQTAHHLCRKMDLAWAQPNPMYFATWRTLHSCAAIVSCEEAALRKELWLLKETGAVRSSNSAAEVQITQAAMRMLQHSGARTPC